MTEKEIFAHLQAEREQKETERAQGINPDMAKMALPNTCRGIYSNANSKEYGGTHYQQDAIQVWDFVAANNIPYFEATAIKYLCRWRRKGNGTEDLRKAIHFIEKLIEVESAKTPQ